MLLLKMPLKILTLMSLSLEGAALEVGLSLAPVGARVATQTPMTKKEHGMTVNLGMMIPGMTRLPRTITGTANGVRTPLHISTLMLALPIGLLNLPTKGTMPPPLLLSLPNSMDNYHKGNNRLHHSCSQRNSGVTLLPPPPAP